MSKRVVVTGVGLVSPLAVGTEATWLGILAGRSGIGPITQFDAARHSTRFAGEVKDFDPLLWIDKKDVKKCGRFIQFAIAATMMAVEQSRLVIGEDNFERVGVAIGSGIGGFEVIEREHQIPIASRRFSFCRRSSTSRPGRYPCAWARGARTPPSPPRAPRALTRLATPFA
jgi:3-oxoacyl-[acyl-carrier-protein] synthase II